MMCEMCGSEEKLYLTDIEGTELNVCKSCAKFGEIRRPVAEPRAERPKVHKQKAPVQEEDSQAELIQVVVDDFGRRIRDKRERLGLKQKELAKSIAEKESLIQKMESGSFTPSLELARKLERFLKISLIEQHKEEHQKAFKAQSAVLTIGDMLSMRSS